MSHKEDALVSQAIPAKKKSDHYDDSKSDETMDAMQDWFEVEIEMDSELDTLEVDENFFGFAQEQD